MAERIADFIKFAFQYNLFQLKSNLNIYKNDLTGLFISKLKYLFRDRTLSM